MGKKVTNIEDIITRCVSVHGNKYDYSKIGYVNSQTKISIICPIHGEFQQFLSNHLKGCGCQYCSNNKRLSTKEYISLAKKRFQNTNINFDKIIYINNHTPITLECPIHGEWRVLPSSITKKCICPSCQKENIRIKNTKPFSQFLSEANNIHNNKYSYNENTYVDGRTKTCIICPIHDEFWQTPQTHLKGCGCPECANIEMWNKRGRMTTEGIIEKFQVVHGDKYDYSEVHYISARDKVSIICHEHGKFLQLPYAHIKGQGCPKCGKISIAKHFAKTTEQFISEAKNVHGAEFDYSEVNYVNSQIKVKIGCKKHGYFLQNPMSHLKGVKCPMCYAEKSISDKEVELQQFIYNLCDGNNIRFNVRNIIQPLELDIVNDEMKIAFEYDGLYWHSTEKLKNTRYHLNKTQLCNEKGFQLIHIFEDEWDNHKEIVKSNIENIFDKSQHKINAKQCVVKEISSQDAKEFLVKNHLQGADHSTIHLGMFYNNEIISIMVFDKLKNDLNNTYELTRFCNKIHYSVIDGASKLLSTFIETYSPQKIITYADKRLSNGELYFSLGFKHINDTEPSYFYTLHGKTREKYDKYSKEILVKEGFDENKTVSQIMKERGYSKIYDCGCMLFEMNFTQ